MLRKKRILFCFFKMWNAQINSQDIGHRVRCTRSCEQLENKALSKDKIKTFFNFGFYLRRVQFD